MDRMIAHLYISQITSHLTRRYGQTGKGRLAVKALGWSLLGLGIFCHSTCSVVYSLLGVHLCGTGRQKQTQASTLWEQVIAANTNGLAVTTVHFTVPLKDVNRWSVTAGSGWDWEWYFWIMGSEACWVSPAVREGELENVEWTSGKCVLSIRQVLQTKDNHSLPI